MTELFNDSKIAIVVNDTVVFVLETDSALYNILTNQHKLIGINDFPNKDLIRSSSIYDESSNSFIPIDSEAYTERPQSEIDGTAPNI